MGIGAVAWGMAVGMAASALAGWDPAGPASVLGLAAGLVLVRAVGRGARRWLRWLRGCGPVPVVLPGWPPAYQPWPGELEMPVTARARVRRRRLAALVALAVAVGAWVEAIRLQRQADSLCSLEPGRVAWVGGWVVEPPVTTRFATYLLLREARLTEAASVAPPRDGWRALPSDVEVAVPAQDRRSRSWQPGMWVAARGLVRLPEAGAFPGDFSLRRYLGARGVGLVVEVRSEGRLAVAADPPRAPPTIRLRAALAAMGEAMARRLERRLGPQGAAWARAVVLGHRDALADEDEQALWEAGLGHVLSVSGLHVGLLAGPVVALVRRLPRSRWAVRLCAAVVACATGWTYAGMTGLAAPAVRAGLMQSLGMALWMVGRRASLPSILGVAAAAQMLLSSPGLGADAGFQMSYLATLAIALFVGRPGSGQAPPGPAGDRGARRPLRKVAGRLLEALGLSFAAWAAITPLTALYFGRVSVLGAVVSVVAGPVCGLLLWSALAAALVPSSMAGPAAWVAERSAAALRALALAGAQLEGRLGALRLSAMGWSLPAVAGLAWLASRGAGDGRRAATGPALAALLLGGWALAAGLPGASGRPAALTVAPVGTGWVVAGRSPGGDGWLWLDARPGQELAQALEKAAAALSGLGLARGRVALWSASSGTGPDLHGLPPKVMAMSQVWLGMGEQGPVVLGSATPDPVVEVHAGSIRLRVERQDGSIRPGARPVLRMAMEGAGSLLLDVDARCLAWEAVGIRHCRGDGPVYLTLR